MLPVVDRRQLRQLARRVPTAKTLGELPLPDAIGSRILATEEAGADNRVHAKASCPYAQAAAGQVTVQQAVADGRKLCVFCSRQPSQAAVWMAVHNRYRWLTDDGLPHLVQVLTDLPDAAVVAQQLTMVRHRMRQMQQTSRHLHSADVRAHVDSTVRQVAAVLDAACAQVGTRQVLAVETAARQLADTDLAATFAVQWPTLVAGTAAALDIPREDAGELLYFAVARVLAAAGGLFDLDDLQYHAAAALEPRNVELPDAAALLIATAVSRRLTQQAESVLAADEVVVAALPVELHKFGQLARVFAASLPSSNDWQFGVVTVPVAVQLARADVPLVIAGAPPAGLSDEQLQEVLQVATDLLNTDRGTGAGQLDAATAAETVAAATAALDD